MVCECEERPGCASQVGIVRKTRGEHEARCSSAIVAQMLRKLRDKGANGAETRKMRDRGAGATKTMLASV